MTVGFFTYGIKFLLPHPQIPHRTILLLCRVIKTAWQLLKEKPPSGFFLQSAGEDAITQVLVEIIENRLRKNGEINGFNHSLFGMVSREPKITNVDKKHPDKMPDIFFDLKRGDKLSILNDQDGLFVECKPVDQKHPILSCYCQKGLNRFVDGDYAWAMQDALMVGYDNGYYSFGKLASVLDDGRNSAFLKTISHSAVNEYMYRSSHKREFEWPEKRGQACPIKVSHLWLPV